MRFRWGTLLIPSFVLSFLLLAVTQITFMRASFFKDLGLGLLDDKFQLTNYIRVFSDPFYLSSLKLTVYVSALVVIFSLAFGYPMAYMLARMRSRLATVLLAAVVITPFITIVIKVLGLIIIFSADGPLNSFLKGVGIIDTSVKLMGTVTGVVVGLLHYTLGFTVVVLFSVIQTIPVSLEDAAQIHGACRWRVFWRVVIPLSVPGIVAAGLINFNLSMGAFTAAALMGGGRVLTLPVLIQRTIMLESKYGMAGALSAVLLVTVLLINLVSAFSVSRLRKTRRGIT